MYQANHYCVHPQDYVTELQNHVSPNPVNCGACECVIVGKTLNCAACNSHLHPSCQNLRETIVSELHPGHPLTRLNHCFQILTRRRCAVCSEEIKGVSYTCSPCNFDIHPQCSQLPCRVPHGPEAHHELVLQVKDMLPITNCHVCGERCGQWAYRCDVCSVNVHFWCLASHREGGPTPSTTSRGLERHHFDLPRQLQGQVNYGVPLPVYLPPSYYNYYNAGVYKHHHHWVVIHNHNHIHNNYNYYYGNHPEGGWNQLNHGSGGGGNGAGGGGGSSGGSGGGRIMSRIGKSLAVGLICDFVIKLLMAGMGG